LCCLTFDLRILITPLVSSNSFCIYIITPLFVVVGIVDPIISSRLFVLYLSLYDFSCPFEWLFCAYQLIFTLTLVLLLNFH
jgi:hypothetical protein